MSINVFNDSANIGPILDGIKNTIVSSESLLTLKSDDSITPVPISAYGKSILNETSVSSLRNKILDADTAIEITDNGVGEINFDVDDVLKMQVTSANTQIKNNVIVDTTLTANTSVTTPTLIAQTLRSKQGDSEILFQDNGGTNNIRIIPGSTNYIQSSSNTLSFSKSGEGAQQIIIDHNNLAPHNTGTLISKYNISIRPPSGNLNFNLFKCPSNEQVSLYSHTNQNGGFIVQKAANDDGLKINMFHDGNYRPMYFNSANSGKIVIGSEAVQSGSDQFVVVSSSRFKSALTSEADIDLEGTSKIHFSSNNYLQNDVNHHLNLYLNNNKNFVANTGNTTSNYDYKINSVSKLKIEDTQTTISTKLICPILNSTNIRFTGENTDSIELKSTELRLKKPLYVEYANRKLTLQAGATDNVIYNKNSGLSLGYNIGYNPTGESETVTTSSLNTSKVLIDDTGVSLLVSNTVNALPSNVLIASNSAITCYKDVNIQGTGVKLNFNSNNYLQNDGSNHLNLFLNDDKNFVADTGNDQSSYEFKIDGNSVLKMERDLTSNPVSNRSQFSSEELLIRDSNIQGGSISIQRSGPSINNFTGYINYFIHNGSASQRLFYTGFNDGVVGTPLHYMEDICKSYSFKNSLGYIMKIVSHSGTIGANTNYVEIDNRLECPTLQMYAPHINGVVPADNVTSIAGEINSRVTSSSDVGRLSLSAGGGNDPINTKARIDLYGSDLAEHRKINFRIGNTEKLKISDSKMDIYSDLSIAHRKKITFLNVFHTNNGTTIGQNDLCNEINGAKSTNSQGVNSIYGHMRLSSGWGSSKSSIDLYGFGEVTSNRIITTIENVEVSEVSRFFHDIKISARTQHIYPQADITYDLGVADNNEWRNVYTENISVGGQFHHSDRRIKDNIIDLPNDKGLSFIQKIRPVQFTYKKSTQKRKHWGFIAQEIREVVGSDNYSIWGEQKTEFKKQHIAPSEFLGPIVKSIQELYGLLTTTDKKPIIIKEYVKSTQEHKCNNLELINQLNSYELELLDCNSKLKELDHNVKNYVKDNTLLKEDNTLLKEDNNILKIKNKGLEERICVLEQKLDNIDNKKDDNLLTEDDENSSVMDIMNQRFIELEARLLKTEKKNAKLVTTINKMLKEK